MVSPSAVPVNPPGVARCPAAPLVLLGDRPAGGFDILLMQRHAKSKFAAGDFVFPGGKLTREDNPPDALRWCTRLDAAAAAKTLDLEDTELALAHWIGVIRETFEEVGVLLATSADGGPVRVAPATLTACRRACQADNRAFWELVKQENLRLATDRLVYFAHSVTPEGNPPRAWSSGRTVRDVSSCRATRTTEPERTARRSCDQRERSVPLCSRCRPPFSS